MVLASFFFSCFTIIVFADFQCSRDFLIRFSVFLDVLGVKFCLSLDAFGIF